MTALTNTSLVMSSDADWLMFWLSRKKIFQKARNIEVCTVYVGVDGVRMDDLEDSEEVASMDQVAFVPSLSRTYSLWYRGRYMTITRSRISEANMWKGPLDMVKIRYVHTYHSCYVDKGGAG